MVSRGVRRTTFVIDMAEKFSANDDDTLKNTFERLGSKAFIIFVPLICNIQIHT